jgi:putative transposase
LSVERPNQVWAIDITYIPMARGIVYLAAVMGCHSRRVLAWRLSISMEATFCTDALEEAIALYGARLIQHGSRQPVYLVGVHRPAQGTPDQAAWTAGAAGATTCSSSACAAR